MRRCPKLVAGSLAALLASSAVAPTALAAQQASPPPPVASSAGLLDGLGLGGTLGSLLGGLFGASQQQQLQQILTQLQGGQAPSGAALAPLRSLLDQAAGTPGLPAGASALIDQVGALLQGNGTDPLAAGLLAPVATLLRQLGDTDGVPAPAATLLDQVADALGTLDLAGLPLVDGLSLDADLTSEVNDALTALANGAEPTGELLAPVAELLGEVSATPGLPSELKGLIDQVANALQGTAGALDPLLSSQLATLLSLIGNTPGVTPQLRGAINRSTTSLGGSSTTSNTTSTPQSPAKARQATRADRAVVKSLRVNRARTLATARIACPRSAPSACATTSTAKVGSKRAARAKHVRLGRGVQKTVRLRLVRSLRASMAKQGGTLRYTLTTRFGKRSFSAQRNLRVARPARGR